MCFGWRSCAETFSVGAWTAHAKKNCTEMYGTRDGAGHAKGSGLDDDTCVIVVGFPLSHLSA